MKFGKQIRLGTFEPWKDYYIQYDKLKRIIKRKKFLLDKKKDKDKKSKSQKKTQGFEIELSSEKLPDETTPLNQQDEYNSTSYIKTKKYDKEKGSEDFFGVLVDEIYKINNFYVGKLAELKYALEKIINSRSNIYRAHHTSSESDYLVKLREIYLDLRRLKTFSELCKTGVIKIIKKYDKVLDEKNLEDWKKTIEEYPFSSTATVSEQIELVTSLVSRDKLMEWEMFANELQSESKEDIFPSVRVLGLSISLLAFIVTSFIPLFTPNDPFASKCMSLLIFVICLWVTEAIPYFATALLIPLLIVVMGVLRDPTDPKTALPPEAAASFVLNNIFNHTTMLLLGGYTISTAFSRCQLELRFASFLQRKLGSHPNLFILAIMFLGLFLSMWISNHTAPILCASIVLPIVKDLPTDSRFTKALLLGLAYSSNFGGMMTPISSLQNVLAVSYLEQEGIEISFGGWLLVSIPFCVFCTLISWLFIILIVNPNDIDHIKVVVYERTNIFSKRNVTIIVLSLLTILLFSTFNSLKSIFGDIGIVSLGFVSIMFGTGMLSEVDFNSLSWHTLFLVGGGNVLGKAIASSGLLGYLSDGITKILPLSSPWLSLLIILFFCVVISTFVSHTVASLILMPIISTIGTTLEIPEIVVIGSAFAVSAAMGLPFSSFPNVNSLLLVDDFQRPFLNVSDFVKTGVPLSLLTVILIATIGFILIDILLVDV